ncbi:MAG TPA: CoA transferase [Dehalococcoidia bacterium]|nr:CoA transferase [Dehalococcoidia bacterium]
MTTDDGPAMALKGLRVVEVGSNVSAPFAGKLLADFGADVVKIEPPGTGDPSRRHGPFPDHEPHPERSALFLALNTNKRSLTLDLDSAAGQSIFRTLAGEADAIVENTKPGTMEGRGLSWESLSQANPKLVMTSVTPFGQTGPYASYEGPNLVEFATGGQMHMTGSPDREPLKNGGYMSDHQAGLNAFSATAVATLGASLHGEG